MGIFHMQCYFYPYFSVIIKSSKKGFFVAIRFYSKNREVLLIRRSLKNRGIFVCVHCSNNSKKIFPRSYATFERRSYFSQKMVAMTTFAGYEDVLNGVEIPDHQLCFDDKKYGGVARKIYHGIHYSVR